MWCMKCNKHLSECTCPDLEERLKNAASSGALVYKYCKKCGHHYEKCGCDEPEWALRDNKSSVN